jgi:hypothetical protein
MGWEASHLASNTRGSPDPFFPKEKGLPYLGGLTCGVVKGSHRIHSRFSQVQMTPPEEELAKKKR